MFGLPTNGEHSFLFTQSIIGQQTPTNFGMEWRSVPGYEVGDARNILVQWAIDSKCKYLFTVDEDVIGPGNGMRQLLYRMETHPDWTACGGLYCTKTVPPEPLVFKEWGQGPAWDWKVGELIKVKASGAGYHFFRVEDLKNMKGLTEYPIRNPMTGETMVVKDWFKTGKDYTYDDKGKMTLEANTEDSWLYRRMEEQGLQLWIDTAVLCKHYDKNNGLYFEMPLDNYTAVKPEPWNHTPRIANLGSGFLCDPYAVNVDLRDGPGIDYQCDIRKLPEDWADQFDIARARHVLEHFSFTETENILREWVRILKPGGKLEIEVPDLQWAMEKMNEGIEDPRIIGSIYGDQGSGFWNQPPYGGYAEDGRFLSHSYDHNTHRNGFTAKSLGKLLDKIGLKRISGERNNGNLLEVGFKDEPPISGS